MRTETMLKLGQIIALLIASGAAHAVQLSCATDERTDANFCFAESEIRESDGIRSAPFYMGGPKSMRKTSHMLAANCATGVMHIKDREGVSFAGGGPGEGMKHFRDLRRGLCAATVPKRSSGKRAQ